jgi:peptidyl-prolyl cis-trans isomerase A (cyclophilin A)
MNRRSSSLVAILLLSSPWLAAACKQEAAPEPGVSSTTTVTVPSAAPKPSDTSGWMAIASSSSSASASATASAAPSATASAAASSSAKSDGGAASGTADAAKWKPTQKSAKDLDPALAKDKAPAVFKAKFITTKGDFVMEVHRDWSPNGADRFYNLIKLGYYNETRFFRVVDGFMVQWGINGDPAVNKLWQNNTFPDDPAKEHNTRGMVSFATRGPNSRTTQVFINFVDTNTRLDGMGFTPFAKIVDGMNVVDALYKGYGEGAPSGRGPDQGRMQSEGNTYLSKDFDKLDWIKETKIL